jgi:hypothetical protein
VIYGINAIAKRIIVEGPGFPDNIIDRIYQRIFEQLVFVNVTAIYWIRKLGMNDFFGATSDKKYPSKKKN